MLRNPLHPSPFAQSDIHALIASEAEWSRYASTVRLTHPPIAASSVVTFCHVPQSPCRLVGIIAAHAELVEVHVGNRLIWEKRICGAPPVLFPGIVLAIKVLVLHSDHPAEVVIDLEAPEPLEPEPRSTQSRSLL